MDEPLNERSRRTRARLLEATWGLLVSAGPEATTMSAVGKAADVSRRGVYLHFSTRADLLAALPAYVNEELGLESSLAGIMAAPDAATMLDETVRHLVDYHSAALPLLEAIQRASTSDVEAAVLWEATVEAWRKGWGELAVALDAEEMLADRWSVQSATDALVGLVVGFMAMWRQLVIESGWSRDDFHAFYLEMFRTTFLRPG